MTDLDLGVSLPIFGGRFGGSIPDVPTFARHAEDVGLDSVWVGDHLATGAQLLDSTVALSTAAAVTSRVRLGYGVMLLAMRNTAWAAKQIGSVQHVSGGRVVLGVGVGGQWPDEWHAVGADLAGRGRRTDDMLRLLPGLFAGEPTELTTEPGSPTIALAPAVTPPPVWVGGGSTRALRRTVEHGEGWLGSMLVPAELRAMADELAALADGAGRPTPRVGTMVFGTTDAADVDQLAGYLHATYGLDLDRARALIVAGSPRQVADQFGEYVAAGATRLVYASYGTDVRANYDLVAAAGELLRG